LHNWFYQLCQPGGASRRCAAALAPSGSPAEIAAPSARRSASSRGSSAVSSPGRADSAWISELSASR